MRTIKYLIILALATLSIACSTQAMFSISPITPAAEGIATITQDKNENYQVDVKVKYLADVERLTPPALVYVVWISNDKGETINLGMLVVNSKNDAELKAVSASRPTQIFVTAELVGDTKFPSNYEIFHTAFLSLR